MPKPLEQCLLQKWSLTFHYKWGDKLAIGLEKNEGIQKNLGPKASQNIFISHSMLGFNVTSFYNNLVNNNKHTHIKSGKLALKTQKKGEEAE